MVRCMMGLVDLQPGQIVFESLVCSLFVENCHLAKSSTLSTDVPILKNVLTLIKPPPCLRKIICFYLQCPRYSNTSSLSTDVLASHNSSKISSCPAFKMSVFLIFFFNIKTPLLYKQNRNLSQLPSLYKDIAIYKRKNILI